MQPVLRRGRLLLHSRPPHLKLALRTPLSNLAPKTQNTLNAPFISDTVPLAEGVIGPVEELLLQPGDHVKKDDVIAVLDTAKVSLEVKATRSGIIQDVLVKVGDQVKECTALYSLKSEG